MSESYERTAEFYDIVSADRWNWLSESVVSALGLVSADAPLVVDIGAGTGISCLAGMAARPTAEWLAYESDQSMRAIMISKIRRQPEVRPRISILPLDVESALASGLVPRGVDLVLMLGVLGHFSPVRRKHLWQLLAGRLSADGVIVAEAQPPNEVVAIPLEKFASATIGAVRYEGWREGVPRGTEQLTWRLRYSMTYDSRAIYQTESSFDLWPISAHGIEGLAASVGLTRIEGPPGLLAFAVERRGD